MEWHKDKFYTNRDVAFRCIEKLKPYIQDFKTIIEPSAGSGNFLFEGTTHAFDIAPESDFVKEENWFDVDLRQFDGPICVYGNPPYGERNRLSKAFIEKCLGDASVIAFLLPKVFDKHTLQSIFPSEWVLVEKYYPEKDSFTFLGNPYGIDTVFQIWIKGSKLPNLREVQRTVFENEHFSLCKPEEADLFVFGAAPKKIILPSEVKSTNRGYYLKSKIPVDKLRGNLYHCKWEARSSANGGVAWLNKTEFFNNYERNFLSCLETTT